MCEIEQIQHVFSFDIEGKIVRTGRQHSDQAVII